MYRGSSFCPWTYNPRGAVYPPNGRCIGLSNLDCHPLARLGGESCVTFVPSWPCRRLVKIASMSPLRGGLASRPGRRAARLASCDSPLFKLLGVVLA
jgi:hypothetical protein